MWIFSLFTWFSFHYLVSVKSCIISVIPSPKRETKQQKRKERREKKRSSASYQVSTKPTMCFKPNEGLNFSVTLTDFKLVLKEVCKGR